MEVDFLNTQELEAKIVKYAQEYYEGHPSISDTEFDKLTDALRKANPNSPYLQTGWGYSPQNSPLEKVPHQYASMKGISRKITPADIKGSQQIFTTKLDGASVGVYYENGIFQYALTRGDGNIGLDISDKIKGKVPYKLNTNFIGRVRGEFVLPTNCFKNKYQPKGMKSPRNAAAGLLTSKKYDPSVLSDFQLICYTVTDSTGKNLPAVQAYDFLSSNGFQFAHSVTISRPDFTVDKLEAILSNLMVYDFDGYRDIVECDGFVGEDNEGLFAVKWNIASQETTVRDINWQISRHGKLAPVVRVDPVDLEGATISNVSGFNAKFIYDNGVDTGAKVEIVRSGDVIPYITRVVQPVDVSLPTECPVCGCSLITEGVDLVCPNPNCGSSSNKRLKNFIACVAPVDNIGDSVLDKYFAYYDIHSVMDLAEHLQSPHYISDFVEDTPGMGEKIGAKIQLMEKKLTSPIPANDCLCGLGLRGIGRTYSDKIFQSMTLDEFAQHIQDGGTGFEGILNITGVDSIQENCELVYDVFSTYYVVPPENNINISSGETIGVCITGKLSKTRKAFLEEIGPYGFTEVPIAKAKILITDNPNGTSSKNIAANKKGIPKMTEAEFRSNYII